MEIWQLWLLATLSGWNILAGFVMVVCAVTFVIFVLTVLVPGEDFAPTITKHPTAIKVWAWALLASSLVLALVPNTKQAWTIIGAYAGLNAIQKSADIPGVEDIPPNVVKAMNSFLEQYVNEKEKK